MHRFAATVAATGEQRQEKRQKWCFALLFLNCNRWFWPQRHITNLVIDYKSARWSVKVANSPAETPSWHWLAEEEKTRRPPAAAARFIFHSLFSIFYISFSTPCPPVARSSLTPVLNPQQPTHERMNERASLDFQTKHQSGRDSNEIKRRKNIFETAAVRLPLRKRNRFRWVQ